MSEKTFEPVEGFAIVNGDGPFFDFFSDKESAEMCLQEDDEEIVPAMLVPLAEYERLVDLAAMYEGLAK